MKRIYLLMTLALGLTTAANAQRSIDMQLISTYPTGGLVLVSTDEDPDEQTKAWRVNDISFEFKNNGPDDVAVDDTVKLGFALFGQIISLNVAGIGGIPATQSGFWGVENVDFIYNADNITESGVSNETICDSLWVVDVNSNVVADPEINTSNRNCQSIAFHAWFLNVADVNNTNGFSLFPNPAATKLNLVSTFNNAKNATVVIRDIVGKTVFTQNLGTNLNGQQSFVLDISNFVTGMYVIDLNVDGKRITRQIQVQK